jgi:diaminopimelate decarboxylase
MIDADLAHSLLRTYGSPLYAYDLDEVDRRARTLLAALPPGASLFYSLKANPLPALVRSLKEQGCNAEISSLGRARPVTAAVSSPSGPFEGPKTHEEMTTAAVAAGIATSRELIDVRRLDDVARSAGVRVQVLVRINPAVPPRARLAMTGVPSQFGFEEEALNAADVPELHATDLAGVHVYYGTQMSAETLVATTESALEAAARVSDRLGFRCRIVDAGGGFPWPYASSGDGPDLGAVKDAYADLADRHELARSNALWFQSGRYLCAASGTLLATVVDVKESKGKKFIVLDTGINHLGGMSGLADRSLVDLADRAGGLKSRRPSTWSVLSAVPWTVSVAGCRRLGSVPATPSPFPTWAPTG